MRINTNLAALNTWKSLSANQTNLQKSLERLSSGYRINRAADDAAGLAVSEKMKAQIRGIGMATRNTQDAVSMVQTAEGGAAKVQDMLQRMRELAVQAGSDTLSNDDRSKLQEEFSSLQSEIDRTAGTVQFNGRKLINGSSGDLAEIGSGAVGIDSVSASGLSSSLTSRTLHIATNAGTSLATAKSYTSTIDKDGSAGATGPAINTTDALSHANNFGGTALDGKKIYVVQGSKSMVIDFDAVDAATGNAVQDGKLGDFINYFNTQANAAGVDVSMQINGGTNVKVTSGTAGSSGTFTISDNLDPTTASFGWGAVAGSGADAVIAAGSLTDASTGAALVAGTNYTVTDNTFSGKAGTIYEGISFTLDSTATAASITGDISISRNGLGFQVGANSGETISATLGNLTTDNLGVDSLDINSKNNASSAMTVLDTALSTVSTERAKMGALQNRLENTISTLQTQSENLTAADSRIRDVDMAAEMANFTKFQVLGQASTAMLAQANQLSQSILTLLR